MKLILVFIAVCAAMCYADFSELGALHSEPGTVSSGTDAIVFDQTYSFVSVLNGYRLTGDECYWADDFVLTVNSDIQDIRFWIVYNGGTAPSSYDMAFTQDSGDSDPTNATAVWSETIVPVLVDTGDDQWGMDIYEVTCTIASYPSLVSGQRYWLEGHFHTTSVNDYILVQTPVYGSYFYMSSDAAAWTRIDNYGAEASDTFFELNAPPVALQNETWGTIKSIF
mgnify:CR=1 FL=1